MRGELSGKYTGNKDRGLLHFLHSTREAIAFLREMCAICEREKQRGRENKISTKTIGNRKGECALSCLR